MQKQLSFCDTLLFNQTQKKTFVFLSNDDSKTDFLHMLLLENYKHLNFGIMFL